jgi:hypothetical protein
MRTGCAGHLTAAYNAVGSMVGHAGFFAQNSLHREVTVMRTFLWSLALTAGLGVGNVQAGNISSRALAGMGLGGVTRMSDREGLAVRGNPYLPEPLDGGTFQVLFAHYANDQFNFFSTGGFAARSFSPFRAPLGSGAGARGR